METGVQLKFDVGASPNLQPPDHECIRQVAGRRMSKDGVITIIAQRFRTQQRNRDDALERLVALIREALAPPPPPRRPTRPTLGSRERRLDSKKKPLEDQIASQIGCVRHDLLKSDHRSEV